MKIGCLKYGAITALTAWLCLTERMDAAVIIHVDMDADTVGIQSTRAASPGESIKVAILADVDAGGVSSYGFSVTYDNLEVSLLSADDTPPAPMANLVAGTTNTDLGGGVNQVSSFDGFTFAAGPTSTVVEIGTMDMTVGTPTADGLPDITVGFFAASDGAFDNTSPIGLDLGPTIMFSSGSIDPVVIVPEPTSVALSLFGSLLLISRRRRRIA